VEVKKSTGTMVAYCSAVESEFYVDDVAMRTGDSTEEQSSYSLNQLDDNAQTAFKQYLETLGLDKDFGPAAQAAVRLHDDKGNAPQEVACLALHLTLLSSSMIMHSLPPVGS